MPLMLSATAVPSDVTNSVAWKLADLQHTTALVNSLHGHRMIPEAVCLPSQDSCGHQVHSCPGLAGS